MNEPIRILRPLAKKILYGDLADVLQQIGDRRPFAFRMNPTKVSDEDVKRFNSIKDIECVVSDEEAKWAEAFIRSLDFSPPNIAIIDEKDLDSVLSGEKRLLDVPFIHIHQKFVIDFFPEEHDAQGIHDMFHRVDELRYRYIPPPVSTMYHFPKFELSWLLERKLGMSKKVFNDSDNFYDHEYELQLLITPDHENFDYKKEGILKFMERFMEKVQTNKLSRKYFIRSPAFLQGAILRWDRYKRASFMKKHHIQTPDLNIRCLPLNEILSIQLTKREEKIIQKKVERYWQEPEEKDDRESTDYNSEETDSEEMFDILREKSLDWEASTEKKLVFRSRNRKTYTLLAKYEKIEYDTFVMNVPNKFTYDYVKMKAKMLSFRKELAQSVYSPRRVERYMKKLEDELVEKGNRESEYNPYSREEAHAFVAKLDLNSIV